MTHQQAPLPFPAEPGPRRDWMAHQVGRLPIGPTESALLIAIASHPASVRDGDCVILQSDDAGLTAMAAAVGVSDRHLRRRVRPVLERYHGIVTVQTFRSSAAPLWRVSMRTVIAAPPAPADLYRTAEPARRRTACAGQQTLNFDPVSDSDQVRTETADRSGLMAGAVSRIACAWASIVALVDRSGPGPDQVRTETASVRTGPDQAGPQKPLKNASVRTGPDPMHIPIPSSKDIHNQSADSMHPAPAVSDKGQDGIRRLPKWFSLGDQLDVEDLQDADVLSGIFSRLVKARAVPDTEHGRREFYAVAFSCWRNRRRPEKPKGLRSPIGFLRTLLVRDAWPKWCRQADDEHDRAWSRQAIQAARQPPPAAIRDELIAIGGMPPEPPRRSLAQTIHDLEQFDRLSRE